MTHRIRVLPVKPLVDLTELLSPSEAASLCGVTARTMHRWRSGETTSMTVHEADRAAINLGMHPAQLWGEDWWNVPHLPTPAERKRAWRKAQASA